MTLVEHARRELDLAGVGDLEVDSIGMVKDVVLQIVEIFEDQGYSGALAEMVVDLVEHLLRYEPLTPLIGDDPEWDKVCDPLRNNASEPVYQNKRFSHVFKEGDRAYDINAVMYEDPSGVFWIGNNLDGSWPEITFPYVPHTEYVKIDHHGRALDGSSRGISGLCEYDGCNCWRGGEKLKLEGDDATHK